MGSIANLYIFCVLSLMPFLQGCVQADYIPISSQNPAALGNKSESQFAQWLFATTQTPNEDDVLDFGSALASKTTYYINRDWSDVNHYQDILPTNADDIESMLNTFMAHTTKSGHRLFDILKNGQPLATAPPTRSQNVSLVLDEYMTNGYTLMFPFERIPSTYTAVEDFQTQLSASFLNASSSLADASMMGTSAHIYVTGFNSVGRTPHTDPYDVLVLQLDGVKQWRVCTPDDAYDGQQADRRSTAGTCRGFDANEMAGMTCQEYTLTAGDLLYVPTGAVHNGWTDNESTSMHLTIGMRRVATALTKICKEDNETFTAFRESALLERQRRVCTSVQGGGSCDSSCDYGSCDQSCDSCWTPSGSCTWSQGGSSCDSSCSTYCGSYSCFSACYGSCDLCPPAPAAPPTYFGPVGVATYAPTVPTVSSVPGDPSPSRPASTEGSRSTSSSLGSGIVGIFVVLALIAISMAAAAQCKDNATTAMASGHVIAYGMSIFAFIFSIAVMTTWGWHTVNGTTIDLEIGIFRYKSSGPYSSDDSAEKYDCNIFTSVATDGYKECAKGFETKCGVSRAFAIIGFLSCLVTMVVLGTILGGLRRQWRSGREHLFAGLEWTAFWSTAVALLCFAIVGGAQVSMHVGKNDGESTECNLDALLAGKTQLGVAGMTLCTLAALLCTCQLFLIGFGDMDKLDRIKAPPVRTEPSMNDSHPPGYRLTAANAVPMVSNPAHGRYDARETPPRVLQFDSMEQGSTRHLPEHQV